MLQRKFQKKIKILRKRREEDKMIRKAVWRTALKTYLPQYNSSSGSYYIIDVKEDIIRLKRKSISSDNKPAYLLSYCCDGVPDMCIYTDYNTAHESYDAIMMYRSMTGDTAYLYDITLYSARGRGIPIQPGDTIQQFMGKYVLANCDRSPDQFIIIKSNKTKAIVYNMYR